MLPRFGARAAVVAGSPGGDFLLPSLAATGPQQKADRVVSTFVLDLLQDGETAEFLADAASALRPGGSSASRPCPGARGPVSSTVAAINSIATKSSGGFANMFARKASANKYGSSQQNQ